MAIRTDAADRRTDRAAWRSLRRRYWQAVQPKADESRPLVAPAARSIIYWPLTLIVALLPGVYALQHWDLVPPGPWWGMRGLAVLQGHVLDQSSLTGLGPRQEVLAYRHVAMQPPLFAWLEGASLWAYGARQPVAAVVPSYLAGAAAVVLAFALGKLWVSPAFGLVAAVLTGLNAVLLKQMQQPTPVSTSLAASLLVLWAYSKASQAKSVRRALGFASLAGLALGLALLVVGPAALGLVAIILIKEWLARRDWVPARSRNRWDVVRPYLLERAAGWSVAIAALSLGVALAWPWYAMMHLRHGAAFWSALAAASPSWAGAPNKELARVLLVSPPTLALAIIGILRATRVVWIGRSTAADTHTGASALWISWTLVATGLALFAPPASGHFGRVFLLIPLNFLAAQTTIDLANRRLPARSLIWLAPATAFSVVWWALPELRAAIGGTLRGQRPSPGMTLALHVGFDLLVVMGLAIRGFDRWARDNDARRRMLIGAYLAGVLAVLALSGLREVGFRHRETTELLALRDAIVRRQAERPLELLAVISSESDPNAEQDDSSDGPLAQPGGRLRFVLRSALPHLAQIDVGNAQQLARLPDIERVVVLAGTGSRLSYSLQARLRLEVLYPGTSGLLAAYSTPVERSRVRLALGSTRAGDR